MLQNFFKKNFLGITKTILLCFNKLVDLTTKRNNLAIGTHTDILRFTKERKSCYEINFRCVSKLVVIPTQAPPPQRGPPPLPELPPRRSPPPLPPWSRHNFYPQNIYHTTLTPVKVRTVSVTTRPPLTRPLAGLYADRHQHREDRRGELPVSRQGGANVQAERRVDSRGAVGKEGGAERQPEAKSSLATTTESVAAATEATTPRWKSTRRGMGRRRRRRKPLRPGHLLTYA